MNGDFQFQNGKFIIRDFKNRPPFTNFLPGIAGLDGRPLWAFYVNRGQGIAGFGVGGKELPIMEFSPAEIAYANAPRQGFRTFIRLGKENAEPFSVESGNTADMEIYRSGFKIEERAKKYKISVEYFGVPNKNYSALGRVVKYTNVTKKTQKIEIADGIAQILPFGISNSAFKETGNLLKSWAVAEGTDKGFAFVKLLSSTADTAEVKEVSGGNFFLPVGADKVAVDPKIIFGEDRTKTSPSAFYKNGLDNSLKNQVAENEIFCAFSHNKFTVKGGETVTLCSLIGNADSIEDVQKLKDTLRVNDVLDMQKQAVCEADKIARKAETRTAYPVFDEYVKQCYFDNVLRGGMPVILGGKPYYVFSRKHGDPERDYNAFYIEPKPYSCGNGNFRDVAQNRRNDMIFTPECGDFNVKYFLSLLQADGYNPLHVSGIKFTLQTVPEKYAAHKKFLNGKFTAGEAAIRLNINDGELDELISLCEPVYEASFGEGYWTDHFVYLIDLVNSYLAVYPDRIKKLLYETPVKWFQSGVRLLPVNKQTVKTADGRIRRLYSIEKCGNDGWLKAGGSEYQTGIAAKLLFLVLIKAATLDPLGCGIDMEGGKPGWCDATNGLPALFGSNVADGLELLRLVEILTSLLCGEKIEWAEEQNTLFEEVLKLLKSEAEPQEFYFESRRVKEVYLEKVYKGFGGALKKVSEENVFGFLTLLKDKLLKGVKCAKELADGRIPTYLTFEATEYETLTGGYVLPKAFKARALPHFAEGVAKALAVGEKDQFKLAKNSLLYDKKLKLFLTSEPLDNESPEIGRIRSFPTGWLERESCFLHMSYKLILALLESGMYDEFYEEIKNGLVPFMDPERYGRSTLENSSFIVTSNHKDGSKWGKGYQARLTGANAEALSMWRIMMGAEKPFTVEDGKLTFSLSPKLHKSFFKDNKVSFTLFGSTEITYINESGKNTWDGLKASRYVIDGVSYESVTGDTAENVRDGKYKNIEVNLK